MATSSRSQNPVLSDYALGRLLHEARRAKGLTLTSLATTTGLSPSFISQLERGLTGVSLHSLAIIADALGSSAAAMLSSADHDDSESVSFMAAADTPLLVNPRGDARALVRGKHSMQPLLLEGGPREFAENWVVHSGDELIYMLSGRMQYELQGKGLYDLGPGDSLYVGAGVRHRRRQLGARPCRFISVLAQ